MPPQSVPSEQLGKLFQRRKCWMLADLAHALDYALVSVRRFLKRVGYFRSYTHNGKWYTLQDFPQFNREGIWHHKDIGFSRHGSLTATIAYLVERSSAGLSAQDLAEKLDHPCHAVLTHLHHDHVLDRVKVGGQFRYLATEQRINLRQREQAAIPPAPSPLTSLNTQAAVWVLVEHIKNPALSFEQLAARLQEQRQVALAPESIRGFFQEHGLKKTPAARS